ncbi:MAG: AMP-binding protein, partial [Bdellovibrionia bacterium]
EAIARPSSDSAALQLYTSGTTGKPKGVVLTLGNLTHQQKLLCEAWGLTESDTLLHTLPLHHMHGLCIALLSSLSAGASIAFIPQFSAQLIWEKMASSTVFMAVPTIYAKLFQALDEVDIETQARWKANARGLRLATSGSAALPVTLARRWKEITGLIPLERFGMSEIGVGLSNPLHGNRVEGCVGQPLATVKTCIVEGELWISGPSVFKEYYKRPEATTEAFVTVEGERFFRTGDTVELSEDGAFRILGRTSVDILKSGGYKLSALEIEEAIREHSGVSEVAVIGLPDAVWGDRVTACVVRRPEHSDLSPEALRSFLKERLAPYKVPKEVFFLNELPRNAMGKVVKPELKKQLEHQD